MDIALTYNSDIGGLDISLAGADLAADYSLGTTIMLSLLCDSTAQSHEVSTGIDRRGWWADVFAENSGDEFGSRLWLLEREKVLPETVQRARRYVREALQWMLDDGLATDVAVSAFIPRAGWLLVDAVLSLPGDSRRYRFEWSDSAQIWRLAGEGFSTSTAVN